MDWPSIEKQLLQQRRVVDLFALVRYLYSIGSPVKTDQQYEFLENFLRDKGMAIEYLMRSYDDDPVPYKLLEEFNLTHLLENISASGMEYYEYLNSEKSMSIKAVTNMFDAWEYAKSKLKLRTVLSLKLDGVFSKVLYLDGKLVLGLSRGRSGRSWPMTDTVGLLIPRELDTHEKEVKIYSEVFALSNSLDYLRDKYDPDKFKTEKSSAISMLRRMKDVEDYKHLRAFVHGAEGLGTSISETFQKVESLGFTTVPHIVVEAGEIPNTFEDFVPWLQSKLDILWEIGEELGVNSDGVVWDVDDYLATYEVKGQYSARNIALKLEQWSFDYYPGIVTAIHADHENQKRVKRSCKVSIKPYVTRDRTEARVVNCHNPGILINNGIKVGSKLYFERNSGAVNILIHGHKLKSLGLQVEKE